MADYDEWLDMARDSYAAGEEAEQASRLRSAASRFYYAAYQAANALLLYRGLTPPADREAWSHDATPELVIKQSAPVLPRRFTRLDVARRLTTLYRLRIAADYEAKSVVTTLLIRGAKANAGYILDTVLKILPERESGQR